MTRKPLPLTPNAPHEWCEPSEIFSYVFLLNNENEMVFLCPMLAESLKSLKMLTRKQEPDRNLIHTDS
jgi:hypothetical protein